MQLVVELHGGTHSIVPSNLNHVVYMIILVHDMDVGQGYGIERQLALTQI